MRRGTLPVLLLVLALVPARAALAGPPPGFTTVPVASGFNLPTAFAYAPDGRIFVTEKRGVVHVVDGGIDHVFLDISAETNEIGDRGLLGLTLDPQFASNGWVYLFHIQEPNPSNPDNAYPAFGELFRIRASAGDRNVADLSTRKALITGFDNHYFSHSGSGLRFDGSGRLLVSLGDGSSYNDVDPAALHTYDLDSLNGKLLRIDPATGDGVFDNPYYDPTNPGATRSKVLARGFRNPFRFGIEPASGDVYVGDVGWFYWEEVNRVPLVWTNPDLELNFGWPCYEGGSGTLVKQPFYAGDNRTAATCTTIYPPADGGTGIGATPAVYAYPSSDPGGQNGEAITGGVFYRGGAYPAQFVGRYFFGDFARNRFQTLTLPATVEDFGTPGGWANPVDIQLAPNGNVAYLGIGDGTLHEIVYVGGNRPPTAVALGAPLDGPAPLRVRFTGDQSFDPDGDKLYYSWDFGDLTRPRRHKNVRHPYRVPGAYHVVLTVSDRRTGGAIGTAALDVHVGNHPPTLMFTSPTPAESFAVGDAIPFTLAANDADDGPLGGQSVHWQVLVHHGGHVHFFASGTGTSGTFTVPDHGDDSFVEIQASASDSVGATVHATVTPRLRRVPLMITSMPSGIAMTLDGVSRTTPFTSQSTVGSTHSLAAPANVTINGTSYIFDQWSDGLPATHGFTTAAGGLTLTAHYH